MSDNSNKFMKASLGYTIGNFLIKGITFLTVPLFSRLLVPADYGMVNIYLSYETIVSLILGLGLHASIKSAKYEFKNLDEYCSSILWFSIKNLCVVLFFVNVFFSIFSKYINFSRTIINIMLIQGVCDSIILTYNNRVSLDYKYIKFLIISASNTILNIGLSLFLIIFVFGNNRYMGRILGLSLATILVTVYVVHIFFKESKPTNNKEYINYGLKLSLPLVPHGLSQVLLSQFDRIMIKSMIGFTEAGIYSFCSNISLIPTIIYNSIDQVWMTWFFEQMNKEDYLSINRRSKKMLLMFSLIICFFTAFSPEMIMILAPKAYWNSIYCIIPIIMSSYFIFLYSFPSYVEYYFKKTKMIAIGSISAAVINVVLNYIFIKLFGYTAAAYTTLVAYIFYFLYHWFIAKRITSIHLYSGRFFCFIIFVVLLQGFLQIFYINSLLIRGIIFIFVFILLGFIYIREKE